MVNVPEAFEMIPTRVWPEAVEDCPLKAAEFSWLTFEPEFAA
jgi:hypothetical protein